MRAAVFTLVHNQPFFSQLWYEYYSKYFAAEDIYLFEHRLYEGDPKTCFAYRNVTDLVVPALAEMTWMINTINSFKDELLKKYDYVLYTDIDEFVVADPDVWPGGLRQYIDACDKEVVRTRGCEIVQLPGEKPLDFAARPLLSQREWWAAFFPYDKPLLVRVPVQWQPGCHLLVNRELPPLEKDLFLLHLKKIDFELCFQRYLYFSRLPEEVARHSYFPVARFTDRAVFEQEVYWANEHDLRRRIEPIYERFRFIL